jgi:hypothetical protein
MNSNDKVPVSTGMKFVALLLIVGGVVGIGVCVWIDLKLLLNFRASPFTLTTAKMGVFILLYGWAVWTGRDLWRGRRQALRFAQILFAMQIPLLSVPGFSYEFHTGLSVLASVLDGPHLHFGFQLGSSFTFLFLPLVQHVVIGVNIVALTVSVYLIQKSRKLLAAPPPELQTSAAEIALGR